MIISPYTWQKHDLIIHLGFLAAVLLAYSYLFQASQMVSRSNWDSYIDIYFVKHAYKPTANQYCGHSSLSRPQYVSANDESTARCQISTAQLHNLVHLLGCPLSYSETKILFDSLDVTRNGYISWGEIAIDYLKDDRGALTVYLDAWQAGRKLMYGTGKTIPGRGLYRLSSIKYNDLMFYWYILLMSKTVFKIVQVNA